MGSFKEIVAGFLVACCVCQHAQSYIELEMEKMEGVANPMVNQLFNSWKLNEEWIRSNGQSGLRSVRSSHSGTKNYFTESHGNTDFGNVHYHADHKREVGFGELNMVMNGVQFSTPHLDYKINMPHPNSNNYLATVEIPVPDVPQAVLDKPTIAEQALEMREWFRAFMEEDYSVRDYRNFFKPVLCYLEGWYTTDTMDDLALPAYDARDGTIEATLWSELWQKTRFSAFAGFAPDREGYPFLPHTMLGIQNTNQTRNAQWNYRVACHPLKDDLPVSRISIVDDLSARMSHKHTLADHKKSLAARYTLNTEDSDVLGNSVETFSLLDELMSQIPGLDNYMGNLTDDSFDVTRYDYKSGNLLNSAYYHRFYKTVNPDNNQLEVRHRAFADTNLFFAMTSQAKVSHMDVADDCTVTDATTTCAKSYTQKWSYAVPLEIIYLNPLTKWNPYDIDIKGAVDTTSGQTVRANGRNGGKTEALAFDGVNDEDYYLTPPELYATFSSEDAKKNDGKAKGVLDKTGTLQYLYVSGIHNFMYYMETVGLIRQRFPIVPLNVEGSNVMKEIEALKDVLMNPTQHKEIFSDMIPSARNHELYALGYSTDNSEQGLPPHTHIVEITKTHLERFAIGQMAVISSSETYGHAHLFYVYPDEVNGYKLTRCDDTHECPDNHEFINLRSRPIKF